MKSLPDLIVIIVIVIIIAWGSLFITVLNQNSRTRTITVQNTNLSKQIKSLEQENKDLNQQARDQSFCFVKAFAIYTQTHQSISLAQLQSCNIVASGGATGVTKSTVTPVQSGKPPQSAAQPATNNNPAPAPTPAPAKPSLLQQIINMIE